MDKEKLYNDENAILEQFVKHPGFKIMQKVSDDFATLNTRKATSDNLDKSDNRLLWLGEISGQRKLLATIISRGESEKLTQSWTENKEYLHGRR